MRGFTIIELMVVVTIIAVLTATAIPTYKNYLNRTKLGTARLYADSYNTRIADFYRDNGRFPDNTDLSIPGTIPVSLSQYLNQPNVAYMTLEPDAGTATQCAYLKLSAYFSNYSGDYYTNGTSPYVVYYNYFISHDGLIDTKCAYYEFDPSTSQVGESTIFRDCMLTSDPDASSIMTFINSECAT